MMEMEVAIPALRANGTLPPGIHQATIDELLKAYPPVNQQRQILNNSLQRAIEELWILDATFAVYVDGSYVTRKSEPNDVDLLVKTDRYLEAEIRDHLDQVCPVEAVSLDVNVEPTTSDDLLDFLMTDDFGRPKGIIQIRR